MLLCVEEDDVRTWPDETTHLINGEQRLFGQMDL